MPAEFDFPTPGIRLWLPLAITAQQLQNRGIHRFSIVGRLRPGVTIAAAEAELSTLVARFTADPSYETSRGGGTSVGPLRSRVDGTPRAARSCELQLLIRIGPIHNEYRTVRYYSFNWPEFVV
jgi:hypothetical protein